MRSPQIIFLRFLHAIRVRPRLLTAIAIGLLASILLPRHLTDSTRLLLTWDLGAGFYLLLALWMLWTAPLEAMKMRAKLQDEGALVILTITIFAAVASLGAILFELSGLKDRGSLGQGIHVVLVVGTLPSLGYWFMSALLCTMPIFII